MPTNKKTLEEFAARFTADDRKWLQMDNITPAVANSYPSRFNRADISSLVEANVPPDAANHYPKRFSGDEIADLYLPHTWIDQSKINDDSSINKYLEYNLGGFGIFDKVQDEYEQSLLRTKEPEKLPPILPAIVKTYNSRFDGASIVHLVTAGVSPQQADNYPNRFDGVDIAILVRNNITPKETEEFEKRFNGEQIIYLKKKKIDKETTKMYPARFTGDDVIRLLERNIPPLPARLYHPRFGGLDVANLFEARVKNVFADRYDQRFSGSSIAQLYHAQIPSWKACCYHQRFNGGDIAELIKAGVSPAQALKYDHLLRGDNIAFLWKLGLTPKNTSPERQRNLLDVLELVTDRIQFSDPSVHEYSFLGTGAQSLVIKEKGTTFAFKVGMDLQQEIDLLEIVKTHFDHPQHLVAMENFRKVPKYMVREEIYVITINHIPGDSLQHLLQSQERFSSSQTIHYASDIFHGLLELREAGIYHHRDIRPANIMIDEEKDRAMIIDLGIATTDRNTHPKDNRRYGGANDLVSLGQIIYKMATGKHLFSRSMSMECTTYAEKLKDHRDWIYEDPKRLERYLQKVEQNIRSPPLRQLTTFCLTATGEDSDYQKLEQRFKDAAGRRN